MVVGDDAQSIYSASAQRIGAETFSIFPTQFRRHVEVVRLEQNYRSTQPILDASNAIDEARRPNALTTKDLFTTRGSVDNEAERSSRVVDEPDQALYAV